MYCYKKEGHASLYLMHHMQLCGAASECIDPHESTALVKAHTPLVWDEVAPEWQSGLAYYRVQRDVISEVMSWWLVALFPARC